MRNLVTNRILSNFCHFNIIPHSNSKYGPRNKQDPPVSAAAPLRNLQPRLRHTTDHLRTRGPLPLAAPRQGKHPLLNGSPLALRPAARHRAQNRHVARLQATANRRRRWLPRPRRRHLAQLRNPRRPRQRIPRGDHRARAAHGLRSAHRPKLHQTAHEHKSHRPNPNHVLQEARRQPRMVLPCRLAQPRQEHHLVALPDH